MKKILLLFLLLPHQLIHAQDVKSSFNTAYRKMSADNAFRHASIGLFVIDNSTGKVITDANAQTGLTPASCQKVITAATSFELLGHDYIYKTSLGYKGKITNGVLLGDLIIKGSGDPTLGSWRYNTTTEESVIDEFKAAISRAGINEVTGHVYTDESSWTGEVTPDGWIWEDIGNYYGAGARALNWRENQYDLLLHSGKNIGDSVTLAGTTPGIVENLHCKVLATSAAKGSGDNTYIFAPLGTKYSYVRGTIPIDENHFTISGSMPQPARQMAVTLEAVLKNMPVENVSSLYPESSVNADSATFFYSHTSPILDSIVFWFLKKSINLYGESLIKTLGHKFAKTGATDSGVNVIQRFWNAKGIEPSAINIIDGSGLSPANRVTAQALVSVMQYAKKQSWFPSFYKALPEINGIKMKSGSIGGVVSYTGYVKSKAGIDYTFAFIINNFDGKANDVREKMWALLDLLK